MEITEVLDIVKDVSEENIKESKHFKDKCENRELNKEEVLEIIQENKVVGVEEQDEEESLYKITFYFTDRKDLNVVIKILSEDKIKLITVFPSYSERRKR